ncbi:MAG: DUF255 domain-containing protein [Bacteroidia bacterium]
MNKKSILISFTILLIAGITTLGFVNKKPTVKSTKSETKKTNTASIKWYNMTDGYAEAKKSKKMLIIDVYTDWCYWCKVMDVQTYENAAIIEKMNKYFVAVKFNPEKNGNHTINGTTMSSAQLSSYLAKGGRIPGYPTTFTWKKIDDQKSLEARSGYLDTTSMHLVLNKMIQE